MRADSETNFLKITKKFSKKILKGNSKEAPCSQQTADTDIIMIIQTGANVATVWHFAIL